VVDNMAGRSPRASNHSRMPLSLRLALPQDIASCIELRGLTRENAVPAARLAELGITEASWSGQVRQGELLGFVAEDDAALVGYCFGDVATGEIVVLALLPNHEGLGLGRQLLTMTVDHLKLLGHSRLFLGCSDDPSHRSYGFYRRLGWLPAGERDAFGDEVLELDTSDLAAANRHPYSQSP
jgi:ribosomal protein S18 acetylase RimI-like enzyme